MAQELVDYRSSDDDNHRWLGFVHRPADIVISTRSKHGTTWMQMICALLVFQEPELPAPLVDLSPWLDWLVVPRDEVFAQLEAQTHRRFIKSHTPLDGIPLDSRVTYIVVARHPLDGAMSLYHHRANIDRARQTQLLGQPPAPASEPPDLSPSQWLRRWVDADPEPAASLESLPGVLHHLSDAWARQADADIVLIRFQDLLDDLEGQMRRVAAHLGIAVPEARWPELVAAARFDAMRTRAAELAPDRLGVLRDPARFFRAGQSGDGVASLSDDDRARYFQRTTDLAPADLLAWLHGV